MWTHQSWVPTVAFSSTGTIASMDQDGVIGVWSTANGKKIAAMSSTKVDGRVYQPKVSFSPDGKYLATASADKAQIWEVATGKEVARREHGSDYMWDVAFSPNGKYLATASLWFWRPNDLINEACSRLTRNLTPAEWRQYVGKDKSYHATLSALGIPKN